MVDVQKNRVPFIFAYDANVPIIWGQIVNILSHLHLRLVQVKCLDILHAQGKAEKLSGGCDDSVNLGKNAIIPHIQLIYVKRKQLQKTAGF